MFIQDLSELYVRKAYRHSLLFLAGYIAITLACIFFASKLTIKTDFFELLPENYRSVQDLHKLLDRIGGVGNLIVAVESDDFEAGRAYVDVLASEFRKLPKDLVKFVDHRIQNVKDFYTHNFLFFIDPPDLIEIRNRLRRKIDYEKKKNNPMFLDDDELKPVSFDIDDIKKKYKKENDKLDTYRDGYYVGENDRLFAIMIKPYGVSAGVRQAELLISKVEAIIAKHDSGKYHPTIKVGLCGNFKSLSEEYDIIINDVVSTVALCVSLVAGVIFLFFLKLVPVILLPLVLGFGVSWTFCLTYFKIGYLNTQTAFLASLIVGTGVNYGILYLARFYEENKKQGDTLESLVVAAKTTLAPTFMAAATTAVSFTSLLLAHNRGFSHFGFIGSTGVLFCWLSTMLILPILVKYAEAAVIALGIRKFRISLRLDLFTPLSGMIVRFHKTILFGTAILVGVSGFLIYQFYPDCLEHDFSKLRNRTTMKGGSGQLDERVSKIFNESLTPGLIVVDKLEHAEEVCNSITKKRKTFREEIQGIATCHSIFNLLPRNQKEKIPIISQIKTLLYDRFIKFMDDKALKKVHDIREKILERPLTLQDIPHTISKYFTDVKGNLGSVVRVDPHLDLKDGRLMAKFAELTRKNVMSDGTVVYSSGEYIIFSDLLVAIAEDGPKVTLISFLGVLLVIFILIGRSFHGTASILFNLLIAVTIMLGAVSFFEIRLNFFSFIALPLTFGIGVDYALNIFMRYRQDNYENWGHVLKTTGNAVLLCSLTTILSYITLTRAYSQALASFGKTALLGEIACIIAALFIMPSLSLVFRRKKA